MPEAESERGCIVVVEDDPALLGLLIELLRGEGYEVAACAEGGTAALGVIRQQRPDLVLLDYYVGGEKDGRDVLEGMLTDAEARTVPVIVSTGAAEELRGEPLLRREGVRLLAKPYDLDALLGEIGAAIGRNARPR